MAVITLAGFWFSGCDSAPLEPSPIIVGGPNPGPSAGPSPDPRCEPRYCDILGDSVVFGIGPKQERELKLLVLDSFRTPIDNKCEYPRRIAWSHDGPIQPVGSRSGSAFRYYALTTGDANVYVEVGDRANCRFSIRIEE